MMAFFKKHNQSKSAFTLIEMIIVLIIIGILLMATVYMSWEQIQKVKNKTVKEAILAEMQSRYSRNLWSSSFWWIYDTMEITFSWNDNKFDFKYKANGSVNAENIFKDNFEIKYITTNLTGISHDGPIGAINLSYNPYNIRCKIWDDESKFNVAFIVRVNNNKDYCFEINQWNCRLLEMSENKCDKFIGLSGI